MNFDKIKIICLPQLNDNYSFLIISDKDIIIIDPAESHSIIKYIKENELNLKAILITHNHLDHISGIKNLLKFNLVPVYSPNKKIIETTNLIKNKDIINLQFIKFEVIETPGHTLDHVIFYDSENKILFSGDTLFRFGCGRVFEGTLSQMHQSLNKIKLFDNNTTVFCGHEYTLNNLNFLISIFNNNKDLIAAKTIINKELINLKRTIPFNLGKEKELNPFLSSDSPFFAKIKKEKEFTNLQFFSFLRDLKDNY